MLTQGVLTLSLVVRMYDASGVAGENLAKARRTVDRILQDAGVAVTWTVCPCAATVGTGELVIRIVNAPGSIESQSLGFSYVDVERKAGTLATVFANRVHALAAAAGADDGELLGRATAHEISHLLLGTREHEYHGLMRGRWTRGDLVTERPRDWMLSHADRISIRQAIARRAIESVRPAAVTADADQAPDVSAQ